jgi:peptide/nickel transport system substrate-binding protein
MNSLKKPLDDIKVRKAICYGINKDAINTVLREGGKVIPGPVSPDSKTFNSAIERYSYDPEKSKQLLVEAGWKDENNDGVIEKDGKPLEITLVTTGTSPEWLRIAEIVQEQLSNLGIDVKIKHLETGAVMKALKTGSFDMAIKVDTGATSIPQDFLTTYHSAPRGGWIAKIIKNSTIDSLISRYNETTDPEKQIELSRKIQQEITNNAPVALYWEDYRIIAMNNKIKNFKPVPGWSSLRNLWKAELGD